MPNHPALPLLLSVALFAGCAVGPDYKAPAIPPPASFHQTATLPTVATEPESRWWRNFGDPVLDDLVASALARNHDLRIARARLTEARALRRGALWALGPEAAAGGRFDRRRLSEVEGGAPGAPVGETWSVGFDAAWELDLFGRNRRRAEAAAAETGVVEAGLRATQVSLLAELAASYFSLRQTEITLELVRQQAGLVQRSLEIANQRLAAGRGTRLDTARLESLWHETRSRLPSLEQELAVHHHRLAVLVGLAPGELNLPSRRVEPATPATLALGSPAGLLRRRPDVQRAERTLAAATALAGADTAAFFPTVSVSGVLQFVGLSSGSLGDRSTASWNVTPALRWDLLNYGRLRARLQGGRARTDAALADYEKSVLIALEDVENSLARYRAALARRASLDSRMTADEAARALAQKQDEAGGLDPLARLDVERAALASARDAIAARRDQQLALVALYKSFAGGWNDVNEVGDRGIMAVR